MSTILRIRNWSAFQHYKDRGPIWIKVYGALLDDLAFLGLPEIAQAQLVKLWLLASRRENCLPDNANMLRGLIGTKGKIYLEELLAAMFLERIESSSIGDSIPLAPNQQTNGKSRLANCEKKASVSRARTRVREELEGEKETTHNNSAREAFLEALPPERRIGWGHILANWEQGLGTPRGAAWSAELINAGLAEYLANTPSPQFMAKHVLRYVEQVNLRLPAASKTHALSHTGRVPGRSFLDLVSTQDKPDVAHG